MNILTVRDRFRAEIPAAIASKLSSSETSVVMDSMSSEDNPKICEMDGHQVEKLIGAIVLKASIRLGSKPKSEEDQAIINREINMDLMQFPNCTASEILRGLKNGLDGKFTKEGNPVIFTPSNFVQWIRADIEEVKKPIFKKLSQLQQQSSPVVEELSPEEERKQAFHHFIWALREEYNGFGYEDYGNAVYDFLESIGEIGLGVITKEMKWNAINQATAEIKLGAAEKGDQKGLAGINSAILEMYETGTANEKIISRAKRILIRKRFAEIVSWEKEDIADLFEQIKLVITETQDENTIQDTEANRTTTSEAKVISR